MANATKYKGPKKHVEVPLALGADGTVEYLERPADTDNYTAKDAISDATSDPSNLEWDLGVGNWGGRIRSITFMKSGTGTTGLGFRLYMFSAEPTAVEDNAAWDPSDTDLGEGMLPGGGIDFADGDEDQNASTNIHWAATNLDIPFVTDAAGKLYGHLVATGTYNPASAERFYIKLGVELD